MSGPTIDFWQSRFESGSTPWDRGAAHPQLQAWAESGALPAGRRILVPGCGNGWEVAALAARGLQVTGIDYTPAAVEATRQRLQAAGLHAEVEQADVLQWAPPEPVDLVYEQTCLCALHPDHWVAYAGQLQRWLVPQGRLLALFVQMPRDGAAHGLIEGPPYHCDINAMRALFVSPHWLWPRPPYERVAHPNGMTELVVELVRA